MQGEWWEILIAVMIFSVMVGIKDEIEQQHLAEYIRRRAIEVWLSGQGPPNLYVPPNPRKPQTPSTTE